MSFFFPFLLIAGAVVGHPAPVDNAASPPVTVLTGFRFAGCDQGQQDILNQNVQDAKILAAAGLDYINDELSTTTYPRYGHQQVDFSKQAAIDFFGPESQNVPYQQHIFGM